MPNACRYKRKRKLSIAKNRGTEQGQSKDEKKNKCTFL